MSILQRRLVRVAAVVLAACLVSGLATGTRDAAAGMKKVQNKDPLEYGSAAGDADLAGTVVVSPASAKTVTGGAFDFGGVHQPADFQVKTQTAGESYSCTLPGSITLTSGGNTMTVDTYTDDAGATPTLVGGSDTFNVGATLHVGATQVSGTYSGTFSVTVNYN